MPFGSPICGFLGYGHINFDKPNMRTYFPNPKILFGLYVRSYPYLNINRICAYIFSTEYHIQTFCAEIAHLHDHIWIQTGYLHIFSESALCIQKLFAYSIYLNMQRSKYLHTSCAFFQFPNILFMRINRNAYWKAKKIWMANSSVKTTIQIMFRIGKS